MIEDILNWGTDTTCSKLEQTNRGSGRMNSDIQK